MATSTVDLQYTVSVLQELIRDARYLLNHYEAIKVDVDAKTAVTTTMATEAERAVSTVLSMKGVIENYLNTISIPYEWNGTRLRLRQPDGRFGPSVDLIGAQGVAGPEGPQGLMGPSGPKGPKGDPALGIHITGIIQDELSLPEVGEPGECWIHQDTGDCFVFLGGAWVNGGPLRGPQGEQGEPGLRGEKGDRGAKGDVGPAGETGPQGERGEKGDRGDVGLSGERGPQGERGQAGRDGTNGVDGTNGARGDTGPQGIPGAPGAKGDRGDQGLPGQKGDRGDIGLPGPQGIQGNTGQTGPAAWSQVYAWTAGTAYTASPPASVVTYGGETYVCRSDHTSLPTFSLANWTKISAKGDTGPQGTQGPAGPAPDTSTFAKLSGAAFQGGVSAQALTVSLSGGDAILTLDNAGAPANTYRTKQIFSTVNDGSSGNGFLFRQYRPSDASILDYTLRGPSGSIWTSGNFNPGTKADLTGAVFTGDITTHRGDKSGVIFLGRQDQNGGRYLYYDGGNYTMPGTELFVNGGMVWRENNPYGYKTSVTVSNADPFFQDYTYEPSGLGVNADTFYLPHVSIHTANNPVGHREQFHTEMRSYGASNGKFVVGFNMGATIYNGSGNAFAFNGVTIIEPGASAAVEASVCEMNTVVKRDVIRKTGLQLVDCVGSGGRGTVIDAALLISKQNGAFGNAYAIQIGAQGDANQWPVRSGIMMTDAGSVETGIDLRRTSVTSGQAILLAVGSGITWDTANGGSIRSDGGGAMQQIFYSDGLTWRLPDGSKGFSFNLGSSALVPANDANASLGQPTQRWNTVFAATGSIQTSDGTLKKNLGTADDKLLDAIGDIELVLYQFLASIEEKGDAARIHSGVIAQQVAEALASQGLIPSNYSFWCEDPLMEDVVETEEVREPEYREVSYTDYEFVQQDNGTAIYTEVVKTRQEPVLENIPVFMPDGTPHITAGTPARMTANADGETVVAIPETFDRPTVISRPKTKLVTRTKTVQRQRVDADGKPMTILGIRYSDLSMLLHAWNRREIDRLKQKMAA
jgi:hypothetical protein